MKMASVQPEKLILGLQSAVVPEMKRSEPLPARERAGVLALLLLPIKAILTLLWRAVLRRSRTGIPHGVENVLVQARKVHIDPDTCTVKYCHAHSYEVIGEMPEGDGGEYPPPSSVDTEVVCDVPRTGYCNVLFKVSVNGSIHAVIQDVTPMMST